MNHPIQALLFDLDGTLLDSFPGHYRAYEATFGRYGIALTKDRFLQNYTPNWLQMYAVLGLPPEMWDEANRYWLEEAARQEPMLFPGVREALEELAALVPLGLVTSGTRERVARDLNRTGITHLFAVVVDAESVSEPKPSPEGLRVALAQLGVQPGDALYVGDSEDDYRMAQAAGVAFVGVTSQFSAPATGAEYRQIDSVGELAEGLFVR